METKAGVFTRFELDLRAMARLTDEERKGLPKAVWTLNNLKGARLCTPESLHAVPHSIIIEHTRGGDSLDYFYRIFEEHNLKYIEKETYRFRDH